VLYGTTYFGGTASLGTVFQLSPPSSPGGAWTKTILTSFGGSSPLSLPSASVTLGPNGVLYGTTAGAGGAYQLTPPSEEGGAWTQTVIFTFESQNGGASVAPLTLGRSGALFGTSEAANNQCGSVFKLTPPTVAGGNWTERTLYHFMGTTDGCSPWTGVTIGASGVYSAAFNDGQGGGTVFEITQPDE
jgi:uncharacterized repeat protein (TIGR03803 family)